MGFFEDFRLKRARRILAKHKDYETRSIIKEYFGNNYNRFLWSYATSIDKIPEVRTAINTIAEYFSIMPIYHKIKTDDGNVQKVNKSSDDINYVLGQKPNKFQNSIQFWQSCITQLLLNNNLFIEPIWGIDGRLKELFPIPYTNFEFEEIGNNAYVTFPEEPNGKKHNLDDLIYISRFCNLAGGRKNDLGLYEKVIQAMNQQILNYCSPRKVKALMSNKMAGGQLKEEDKQGATKTLKASFDANVEGIAYLDEKWQITPVNWNEGDVNKDLKDAVINTVYNYFGISDKIINHTATEAELDSFISQTIKALADQFEVELTTKLFTKREQDVGHRVEFDVFALSIATLQAKTAFMKDAIRNGVINQDEFRNKIGFPPLPNGLGKNFRISLDLVDMKIADEYQLKKLKDFDNIKEEPKKDDSNASGETDDDIENKKENEDGDSKK